MKVLCERKRVYVPASNGRSVELKIGENNVDDAIAKKLILRGLVAEIAEEKKSAKKAPAKKAPAKKAAKKPAAKKDESDAE
jgi:topoisomerase IA-like protein